MGCVLVMNHREHNPSVVVFIEMIYLHMIRLLITFILDKFYQIFELGRSSNNESLQ